MIKLSQYIKKDNIFFIESDSKEKVFEKIFEILKNDNNILNFEEFRKILLKREEIISTGIGLGFAIPHIKSNILKDFFISIFILKNGVNWNSIDNKPVKVVILICGPENHNLYLQILSKLILIIRNSKDRKIILNSCNKEEIYSVFNKF